MAKSSTLLDILHALEQKSAIAPGRYFLPESVWSLELDLSTIRRELQRLGFDDHETQTLSHSISGRLKKTFAILTLTKHGKAIAGLVNDDADDHDLPFRCSEAAGFRSLHSRSGSRIYQSSRLWNADLLSAFVACQWMVLAPVFDHLGSHSALADQMILPVTRVSRIPEDDGASHVKRIEIHEAHCKFSLPSIYGRSSNVYVLKRPAHSRDFMAEVQMLHACNESGNPHLVTLVASFTWKCSNFLILPSAAKDLWRLWHCGDPGSVLGVSRCAAEEWVVTQLCGLVGALSVLHNKLKLNGSRIFGVHGDIKASNILVFEPQTPGEGPGILQLADMGSSMIFHDQNSASRIKSEGRTGIYQPPECLLELEQSQAIDLWSIGCLMLEFLVWLLQGPSGLETFSAARMYTSFPFGMEFVSGLFFSLGPARVELRDSAPFVESINPAVSAHIASLRQEPHCNAMIDDILAVVENDLLQIDPNCRISVGELEAKLQALVSQHRRSDRRDKEVAESESSL